MTYVIQVQNGRETDIVNNIIHDGISASAPRQLIHIRKGGVWKEYIKVIFSGYVFVHGDYSAELFHRIKAVSGVIRFLGAPTPLAEHEAEMIEWLSNGGNVIEPSEVRINADSSVVVCKGFLKGYEHKIRRFNLRQRKASVEVTFGGKLHRANLGITISE